MQVERSTGRRWHLLSSLAVKLTSATTAEGECYGCRWLSLESDCQRSAHISCCRHHLHGYCPLTVTNTFVLQ